MSGIPIATLQRMAADGDRQAGSMLARFESRYLTLTGERAATIAAMQPAIPASRPLRSKGEGVNGKETRAAERWHRSRVKRSAARRIAADAADYADLGSTAAILLAQIRGERWQDMPAADDAQNGAQRRTAAAETPAAAAAREHAAAVLRIVKRDAESDADGS